MIQHAAGGSRGPLFPPDRPRRRDHPGRWRWCAVALLVILNGSDPCRFVPGQVPRREEDTVMKAHRIRWALVTVVGLTVLGWGLRFRGLGPGPTLASAVDASRQ